MSVPVFIVCRDRLTTLEGLLDWLEWVGHADEVYLIDNDSTYPPLLDFYKRTRHTVLRMGGNYGHRVGWTQGVLRQYTLGRRFVYSDPDVVPDGACPPDAVARMAEVLDMDRTVYKCGFGLKIDDLADWCREGIVAWESPYWSNWDQRVGAFRAPIDTTFALHSPNAFKRFRYHPAYRLGGPYLLRHLPWYIDPSNLDAEDAYYIAHADPAVSNFARYVNEERVRTT